MQSGKRTVIPGVTQGSANDGVQRTSWKFAKTHIKTLFHPSEFCLMMYLYDDENIILNKIDVNVFQHHQFFLKNLSAFS